MKTKQREYWIAPLSVVILLCFMWILTINVHAEVKSISYKPAKPALLIENIDTVPKYYYNEETGEEESYPCYNINTIISDGDELTVTDEKGTKKYRLNYDEWLLECPGEKSIYFDDVRISSDQNHDNLWGLGKHVVTFCYAEKETEVEVEVIETPLSSIRFGVDSIELPEKGLGNWTEDENGGRYFEYVYFPYLLKEGMKLFTTDKGGKVTTYVYHESSDTFVDADGNYINCDLDYGRTISLKDNQSSSNPWVLGENYPITISYLGVNTTVTAKIVKKPESKITKVTLKGKNGAAHKIAAGKKITLTATIYPKNATNKKLKWISDKPKLVSVNQKGQVTVNKKAIGKTVIIKAAATDGSGKSASWKIKVMKGAVKKISIKGAKKRLKAGKTMKLKAKVKATKGKANKKLRWTSSNNKYATVNASGKVKALKAGKGKTVTITAMSTDGSNKKKAVKIRIK